MKRSLIGSLFGLTALALLACGTPDEDTVVIQDAPDTVIESVTAGATTDNQSTAPPVDPRPEQPAPSESEVKPTPKKLPASAFKTIEWTELMPQEDIDALLNPPSYITDVEDGSLEDQISGQLQNTLNAPDDDPYQQALRSTRVIPEMDGKPIRIPGFIVPLEFDDEQTITEFFLVPFFGACIHVPPPPPNQIIYVRFPEGLKLEALYDPFWISGIINTSLIENEIATSAYTIQMQSYEAYTE